MAQENRREEPESRRENRREKPERHRDGCVDGCFGAIWDLVTFSWLSSLFDDDD